MQVKQSLEHDIFIKTNSLVIDRSKCLPLRTEFPFHLWWVLQEHLNHIQPICTLPTKLLLNSTNRCGCKKCKTCRTSLYCRYINSSYYVLC